MLTQTQETINTLKECGLDRKDFRVRTERIMNGSTFVGYGDVQICLLCSLEKQRTLATELAKHFTVIQYIVDGKPKGALHVREGKPQLIIRELRDK